MNFENRQAYKEAKKLAKTAIRAGRVNRACKKELIENLYLAIEKEADTDLCIEGFVEDQPSGNSQEPTNKLAQITAKAKEIRKEGEGWRDALKRASQLLK
jgi:hypothetical protein